MRIAYICADPGVPVFGKKGCSVHVQEIVRAFRRLGAEVELFAARLGGDPPSDLKNLPVHQVPVLADENVARREEAAFLANESMADLIRGQKRYDLVYERYSLWSVAGMEHSRTTGVTGILEVNAPLIEEQIQHRGLIRRDLAGRIRDKVFSWADVVVAVSPAVADHVQSVSPHKFRTFVVPNGVDPARFCDDTAPRMKPNPDVFTIGFVGTLKPWHGLENLIKAFVELRDHSEKYRLLIVGDGPERSSIEDQLRTHSLIDSTFFTGSVEPSEIPGWLASMDTAVAPYAAAENFYFSPLKVFEYMAAGLPVIVSEVGQLVTIVQNGVDGIVVPAGDSHAIARAIRRLQRDPQLRRRLGAAARRTVLDKHTWEAAAEKILAIAGGLKADIPSRDSRQLRRR